MLKKLIIYSVTLFLRAFCHTKKKIVYHSYPDFSDNSFALFVYVANNKKEYKNIWLVDDYNKIDRFMKLSSNYSATNNLIIVKKQSIKGVFHYITASFIFHTHGLYNFLGLIKNQKKVNLWHGMPIKNIGYLDDPNNSNVQISNFHVATSSFYQDIISNAFGVSKDRVLIIGQARNDFFVNQKITIHHLFNDKSEYNKTILWMTTYRKSDFGDIRLDGNIENDDDFLTSKNISRLNLLLKQKKSICYVKLHPMDYRKKSDFELHSNIRFIDNNSFQEKGISMFSVFKSIDILLTDFSSIYIDFLLLNIPIGFVFSDYEEFKNTRGFVFEDPLKYMPGEVIDNLEDLENFITNKINNDEDRFLQKRTELKQLFHESQKDFSRELFKRFK